MLIHALEFLVFWLLLKPSGLLVLSPWQGARETSHLEAILAGLIGWSLLALLWSFFAPLAFFPALFALALLPLWRYRRQLWPGWPLLALALLFAAYATWPSAVPDDGAYYGQTLEIFRRFGLIPGQGNIAPRLAFASAFHALQAAFYWPQWHSYFALAPFLLLVWTAHLLSALRAQTSLYALILLLASPLLLFLGTAPSPDVVVFLLGAVLIEKRYFSAWRPAPDQILALTALFWLFKPTLALFALAFLFLADWQKPWRAANLLALAGLSLLVGVKDLYLTGYLLFPMLDWTVGGLPWQIPPELYAAQSAALPKAFYGVDLRSDAPFWFQQWRAAPLKAFLLVFTLCLNLGALWLAFRQRAFRPWAVFLLFFTLVWSLSGGFRLGMHVFWPLAALIAMRFVPWLRTPPWLPYGIGAALTLAIFWPGYHLEALVANPFYQRLETFQSRYWLRPAPEKTVSLAKAPAPGVEQLQEPVADNFCWYRCFPCSNRQRFVSDQVLRAYPLQRASLSGRDRYYFYRKKTTAP